MITTKLVSVNVGGVQGHMEVLYNSRNRVASKTQRLIHPFLRDSNGNLKPVNDPDYSHSGYDERSFETIVREITDEGLVPKGCTVVPCVMVAVPMDQAVETE